MDKETIRDTSPSPPPPFISKETMMKAVRVHVWFRMVGFNRTKNREKSVDSSSGGGWIVPKQNNNNKTKTRLTNADESI